jgi:aspartate-semialdehyde dehydrogenase
MMQVLRMVVSTYQAASGAGAAAMEELELQTREVSSVYPISLSFCSSIFIFMGKWVNSFPCNFF